MAAIILVLWREVVFDIAAPFFGAFLISYIANPFVNFCERHGLKRHWGMILFYIIFALLLAGGIWGIMPLVKMSLAQLIQNLPGYIENVKGYFEGVRDKYLGGTVFSGLVPDFDEWLQKGMGAVSRAVPGVFVSVGALVAAGANFIVAIVLSVYFIKDTERIKELFTGLVPARHRAWVLSVAREVNAVLSAFIRGQLLLAILVGTSVGVVIWAFGVPYAPLLAVAAGVLQLVPYFGSAIAAFLILAVTLVSLPRRFIWVLISILALQQIESSFLSPKIVGGSVGLYPAVSILAILTGARLFGFWGILFSIPVFGIIRVLLRRIMAQIT